MLSWEITEPGLVSDHGKWVEKDSREGPHPDTTSVIGGLPG